MAADSLTVLKVQDQKHANKIMASDKIIRHRGHLIGTAGSECPTDQLMIEWFFENLGETERRPLKGFNFTALIVDPDAQIMLWGSDGACIIVKAKYFAIGAGQELALGAMAMGATARQAAAVAVKWSPECSGRISTRKLGGKGK